MLLCGRNTRRRKFIDWELHAAMYDTKKNPKMGILVINLPTIEQCEHASDENDKILIDDDCANWVSLTEQQEYEEAFSYLPMRVMDNISKGIPISVVDWSKVIDNPKALKELIHNAFARRKCTVYKNNRQLKRKNR